MNMCECCQVDVFVPHVYRKDLCRECGHLRSEHINFLSKDVTSIEESPVSLDFFFSTKENDKEDKKENVEDSKERQDVIRELVSTEKDYQNDMFFYVNHCAQELTKQKIISKDTSELIFSNINSILDLHRMFLEVLQEGSQPNIVKAFSQMAAFFKVYSEYCSDFPKSVETIKQLKKKNVTFKNFLLEFKAKSGRKLEIEDFAIKPVQRLCKYPILLREILKHTPPTHPEYEQLKAVCLKINDAAEHVNEIKRIKENFVKIREIQDSVDFGQLPSYFPSNHFLINQESKKRKFKLADGPREFICKQQDVVRFLGGEKDKVYEHCGLILFSDLLLVVNSKNEAKTIFCLSNSTSITEGNWRDNTHGLILEELKNNYISTQICLGFSSQNECETWTKTLSDVTSRLLKEHEKVTTETSSNPGTPKPSPLTSKTKSATNLSSSSSPSVKRSKSGLNITSHTHFPTAFASPSSLSSIPNSASGEDLNLSNLRAFGKRQASSSLLPREDSSGRKKEKEKEISLKDGKKKNLKSLFF